MSELKLSAAGLAAILTLGLASASIAAPAEQKANVQPRMIMTKDPVTGKLRPATAAERAELEKSTAASKTKVVASKSGVAGGPRTIQGKGGAVGMVLDDESHAYSVATRTPGHKISTTEVTGKTAATKATQNTSKPKGGPSEK